MFKPTCYINTLTKAGFTFVEQQLFSLGYIWLEQRVQKSLVGYDKQLIFISPDGYIAYSDVNSYGVKEITLTELSHLSKVKLPIIVGDYTVKFTGDGIEVGCTKVSHEQIAEIYKQSQEIVKF